MRKLFTLCLLVFTLSASAQWQQTGSKVRYVNGLGIPTRDTAAGVAADSSQILIRPADSALYVKYKRTWLRVGGGGGSIAGSGTTNYIPKFTSSTAIGNSQIFDNGTNVGLGTTSPAHKLDVQSSGLNIVRIKGGTGTGQGSAFYQTFAGSTSTMSAFGDRGTMFGTTVDQITSIYTGSNIPLTFDVNAAERMRITAAGDVGIGTASPNEKLHLVGNTFRQNDASNSFGYTISTTSATTTLATLFGGSSFGIRTGGSGSDNIRIASGGNVLIGTTTDNGTDRLQVSGSASVTSSLGIGTSPSVGILHIKTTTPRVVIDDNDNTGTASIWFRPQSASFATKGSIELVSTGSAAPTRFVIASTDTMTFRTNNVERMRVTSAGGNVLISTTTDNNTDKLQVNGSIQGTGFNQAYTAKTGTYTATTSDYFIDCTSGTFTVNLFTAVGNTGRILIIKNSGTGTITVDPNGSQTIDGATTQTLSTQWSRVHIISDGTNWKIISN